jgi:chromosomal replication initiation ATPase DnaA
LRSSSASKEADPYQAIPHAIVRPDTTLILRNRRREEKSLEICEGLIDLVAAFFNVSSKELRRPGRTTAGVGRVRQIAMYVAHVALGLTMNEIGRGFGRDRTTVLYACHLIEDLRDDIEFDRIVQTVEKVAEAAFLKQERRDG